MTTVQNATVVEEETKTRKQPRKSLITWDEETIAEHNKERGTRMKIDEPDTPFPEKNQEDEEGYNDDQQILNKDEMMQLGGIGGNDLMAALAGKLEVEQKKQIERQEATEGEETDLLTKRTQERADKFEIDRKNHYNEFQMMQAFKAKQEAGLNDEDEDEY